MTVRIATPAPSVLLPHRLASPNTGILAPAAYSGEQIDPMGTCTGPFTIVEHLPDQALRLERNADYWGGDVQLEAAEFRFIPDGGVRATQVQTGEAHISRIVPVSTLEKLKTVEGIECDLHRVRPAPTDCTSTTRGRRSTTCTREERSRAAVDAETIAATIYEGSAQAAVGPFAPERTVVAGRRDGRGVRPRAWEEPCSPKAGVDAGRARISRLLAYTERAELPDLAAVIQGQLQQIGIRVDIRTSNWGGIESDLYAGNFDLFLMSRNHLVDVADPIAFLTADYTCEGGFNVSNYCDPAVDALVDAGARATVDPAARNAAVRRGRRRRFRTTRSPPSWSMSSTSRAVSHKVRELPDPPAPALPARPRAGTGRMTTTQATHMTRSIRSRSSSPSTSTAR